MHARADLHQRTHALLGLRIAHPSRRQQRRQRRSHPGRDARRRPSAAAEALAAGTADPADPHSVRRTQPQPRHRTHPRASRQCPTRHASRQPRLRKRQVPDRPSGKIPAPPDIPPRSEPATQPETNHLHRNPRRQCKNETQKRPHPPAKARGLPAKPHNFPANARKGNRVRSTTAQLRRKARRAPQRKAGLGRKASP